MSPGNSNLLRKHKHKHKEEGRRLILSRREALREEKNLIEPLSVSLQGVHIFGTGVRNKPTPNPDRGGEIEKKLEK